jgi:hypothetical protein
MYTYVHDPLTLCRYAPMADAGGVLYDRDAVYVEIPDWKV